MKLLLGAMLILLYFHLLINGDVRRMTCLSIRAIPNLFFNMALKYIFYLYKCLNMIKIKLYITDLTIII
jgi:cellulose synthase/poly-beta-1,6-N-acetylglucosamine synthase-like glycosyltransferase